MAEIYPHYGADALNTTFVVAILLVIEAFNMFESIFVMTQGGPLGSTSTIMYYIYEPGLYQLQHGLCSALAWIFFAIIMDGDADPIPLPP